MKCKYCNAEIEQDAQFCPNCGKDLSNFDKCVKCGELLDQDAAFCPHCGTELPHYVENHGSRKWIWLLGIIVLLGIVCCGSYYFINNKNQNSLYAQETNSDKETDDTEMMQNEEIASFVGRFYVYYIDNYPNILSIKEEIAKNYLTKDYSDKYLSYMTGNNKIDILAASTVYFDGKDFGGSFYSAKYIGDNRVKVSFTNNQGGLFTWIITVDKVNSDYRISNVEISNE